MNLFEYSTPYSLSGFLRCNHELTSAFSLLKFPSKPYIPNDRPVVKASYSQLCTFQSFKFFKKKYETMPHAFRIISTHVSMWEKKDTLNCKIMRMLKKKHRQVNVNFKKNVNDTRSSIDKESSFRRYASNSTIEWTTQTTAVNYLFPFYTTDVCYCGTGIISLCSFPAWMEFMVFFRGNSAFETRASEYWVQ